MNISIEYISKLDNNKNIIIFVSNLSQLKNIDFLPNINDYLKDKQFVNHINTNNYALITNYLSTSKKILNIMIVVLRPSNCNWIEFGSKIHEKFNIPRKDNLTFYFLNSLFPKSKDVIADIIFGFSLKSYSFSKYKDKKNNLKENKFKTLYLYNIKKYKELNNNFNLLKSINITKDLVSEPANVLNPVSFAQKCLALKKIGLKVKVLDKIQLKKIGMTSLLGVSQGSANEPRVVILEWNLKKHTKPTILAGKGVTFDTGGISLKPPGGMEEMITDMAGSAVVVGSMVNAALNKVTKPLVGIIGLVENMPDGKSQRPGDIVNSLSGQTIEILNTDAEGRLVLGDILTYVQSKYKAKLIIDFATLTGAIMIALGTHRAGLFSNNDNLSSKLEIAGYKTGEKLWRLPLGTEYDEEINSSRADMKNIGSSRYGGSIQAAQFIKRFVNKDMPWAHIDIAGVSWTMKAGQNSYSILHSPGATAFGVRLIDKFLKGK